MNVHTVKAKNSVININSILMLQGCDFNVKIEIAINIFSPISLHVQIWLMWYRFNVEGLSFMTDQLSLPGGLQRQNSLNFPCLSNGPRQKCHKLTVCGSLLPATYPDNVFMIHLNLYLPGEALLSISIALLYVLLLLKALWSNVWINNLRPLKPQPHGAFYVFQIKASFPWIALLPVVKRMLPLIFSLVLHHWFYSSEERIRRQPVMKIMGNYNYVVRKVHTE